MAAPVARKSLHSRLMLDKGLGYKVLAGFLLGGWLWLYGYASPDGALTAGIITYYTQALVFFTVCVLSPRNQFIRMIPHYSMVYRHLVLLLVGNYILSLVLSHGSWIIILMGGTTTGLGLYGWDCFLKETKHVRSQHD